ncbi:TonB-dependent receptor [Puniceicoccaceae bacterium K14]|nr:TonB-dependent receptor [Puniceicoccaceae bacterium K14]
MKTYSLASICRRFVVLLSLLAALPTVATYAQDSALKVFSQGAQPLADALEVFSEITGIDVAAQSFLLKGKSAPALEDEYTANKALSILLSLSGLEFRFTSESTVAIYKSSKENQIVNLEAVRLVGSDPKRYAANSASSISGNEVPLDQTPRSIQIVTEQIILDQGAQDLRDVMRNFSGVVTRNISGGTTDTFLLRGVEVGNIFQDGFQLDAGTTRIQTSNIERIEVVKGPNAILAGESQAGGLINVISKRPKEDARHVFSLNFDEFGQRVFAADSTGSLNDESSLLYRFVASAEDSETFRETDRPADIKREVIAPSLTWKLNESSSLTASLEYVSAELPFDNGTVLQQSADGQFFIPKVDRSVRFGEQEDISDMTQRTHTLEYEHTFANDWVFNAIFNQQSAETQLHSTGGNFGISALTPGIPIVTSLLLAPSSLNFNAVPEDGLLLRSVFEIDSDRDLRRLAFRLTGETEIGSTLHNIALGADYNRRESDSTTRNDYSTAAEAGFGTLPGLPSLPGVFFPTFNALDLSNPVYGLVQSNLLETRRNNFLNTQSGAFITDNITFNEQWHALLGVRIDRFEREGQSTTLFDNIPPVPGLPGLETVATFESETTIDSDRDPLSEVSPTLGIVYQPLDQLSLYVSYSESFVPQFFATPMGEILETDPLESDQIEIGFKGSLFDELFNFNLAYFDLNRTNVIGEYDPFTDTLAFNDLEARRGIELDANVQFASGISLIFNYAHALEAEIKEGSFTGNTPRNFPENVANLWATYEFSEGFLRGFGIGGGVTYLDSRFINDNNTFELEHYTTVDFTAFYYLPIGNDSQVKLQAGVKNLGDEEYYTPNNGPVTLGVGTPRTAYGSISYEF